MHFLCGLCASAVNILAGLRWNLARYCVSQIRPWGGPPACQPALLPAYSQLQHAVPSLRQAQGFKPQVADSRTSWSFGYTHPMNVSIPAASMAML